MALLGFERPLHPVRVALPRADARHVAVPVCRRALGDVDPLLVVVAVVEAELHAGGVLRGQGEVDALAVPRGAEREGTTGPHRSRVIAPRRR